MSGICDTCMTAGTCEIRRDGRKLCTAYECNSNYNRLFGTPERAAETIAKTIRECDGYGWHCDDCHFHLAPVCPNGVGVKRFVEHDALLGWLKGDAE